MIRDECFNGAIKMYRIPSVWQLADVTTKPVTRSVFTKLVPYILGTKIKDFTKVATHIKIN